MNEQLEFLKKIARRLDSVGIPYMLTGSMAMAIYAPPRMTRDIDMVIECRPADVERIALLFEHDCYVDREEIRKAIAGRSSFNVMHNEWIIKADFIIRKNEPYREVEFKRRRAVDLEGTSLWVVAPEDLILSKLHWGRETDSELQQRDARAIIEYVADLDWPYLEKWAGSLGVRDQLDQSRKR